MLLEYITTPDGLHFEDDIFKCIFLNNNLWISNLIEICSLWRNGEQASIGSDVGVGQNRQQAIIWTNESLAS